MQRPLKVACIGARGIPSNYSGIECVCDGLYSELALRGALKSRFIAVQNMFRM